MNSIRLALADPRVWQHTSAALGALRARYGVIALAAITAVLAALLLTHGIGPDALSAMTEKTVNGRHFLEIRRFIVNLRNALIPLAVPLGALAMVAVGGMLLFGSPAAQRVLVTVVVGLVCIIFAPEIID